MSKRTRERKMKRAAAKAPVWLQTIAASKFDRAEHERHRTRRMGKFGAASPVRIIAP